MGVEIGLTPPPTLVGEEAEEGGKEGERKGLARRKGIPLPNGKQI